jgi:hypothetical protein
MKKLLFILTLLFIWSAAISLAQEKATISVYRVFAKPGKDEALKKAIAAHAQKFHTGKWKWRVFSVLSGVDEGAYQILKGPNSWTELEGRNDISEEHMRDYDANVTPLVEKTTPALYLTYERDVSSDSVSGPSKKTLIRRLYVKPGKGASVENYASIWKKVYEKLGVPVAAYWTFFSGEPEFILAYRLPNGFIDLEQPMGKRIRETFNEIAGNGAYDRYAEDLGSLVTKIDNEMIEYKPELSSK